MKNSYVTRAFLPAGFALGLFAGPQNFILTTPDSSTQIGKGMFESGSGDSIQVRVTVRGKEFTGSGSMLPPPPKQHNAVRSDRAFMASKSIPYSKHGFATLNAKDGSPSSLTCEFYVRNEQVEGHCFDPADKQSPSMPVYPSHEKQP
jgi:hypothetical protein